MFNQPQTQKQTYQTPSNPTYSIGTKQPLIPNHITKITYREGEGQYAKPGASIKCYYSCHLIDGQQIIRKSNEAKRLSIGVGRLIEGLEIVFLTVRRNQKFVVVVSPDYAYRKIGIDREIGVEIGGIPVDEKLVFQFQVLSIDYFGWSQKCQADVLIQVTKRYAEICKLVDQKQYSKAIEMIDELYRMVQVTPYYRTDLKMLLLMKKTHIYFIQQKYQQSLKQAETMFPIQSTNPHFLILLTKIHMKLKNYTLATTYIKKCYQLYSSNLEIRRFYVDFLKEMGETEILRKLEGYNYEKDLVYKVKSSKSNQGMNMGMGMGMNMGMGMGMGMGGMGMGMGGMGMGMGMGGMGMGMNGGVGERMRPYGYGHFGFHF